MLPRLQALLAAGVLLLICVVPASALSLGPGLFMVQRVPLGQPVDIAALGGPKFYVPNRDADEGVYTLSLKSPSLATIAGWESGYESIPDPSWCRLESDEFTVAPGATKQIGMTITIPDLPENYNRKWEVAVVLQPGHKGGIGVGLAVAARVQIETVTSAEAGHSGGPLALLPATLELTGKPGEAVHGSTLLRNTGTKPMPCRFDRLVGVYPETLKHDRYTSNGYRALVTESWLTPQSGDGFTLAPGAERAIQVVGHIPQSAPSGSRWEELVFIRSLDPAVPSKDRGEHEIVTFLRVQFTVTDPAAPKKSP